MASTASDSVLVDQKENNSSTTTSVTNNDPKLIATCQCGQITFRLPHRPTYLNECQCSICFRYGALWAYYPRDTVVFTPGGTGTKKYIRDGPDMGWNEFHFCERCGCAVCWIAIKLSEEMKGEGVGLHNAEMGVNGRMLGSDGIEGLERRIDPGP